MPAEQPVQRNGLRYLQAESVPWLQNGWEVRRICRPMVTLSCTDRSSSVTLEERDALCATGGRTGYRSIMASEGVLTGDWYFELTWSGPKDSAVRFGVARMGINVSGPIGWDEFGYGWCPNGKVRQDGGERAYSETFQQGDVLGCRICLPNLEIFDKVTLLTNHPKQVAVSYFGLYLEQVINNQNCPISTSPESSIEFFKNGQSMGVAFSNLPIDIYYPTFSLYKDATIHVNFGPSFLTPPQSPETQPYNNIIPTSILASSLAELKDFLPRHNKS